MYSSCLQYILLVAALLSTTVHASSVMMAKLVDGSFFLDRRAQAADGFPLILTNHNDMSYLVSQLLQCALSENLLIQSQTTVQMGGF